MRGRGRSRGRAGRGRRGGVARGRAKKNVKVIESDEEESQGESQQLDQPASSQENSSEPSSAEQQPPEQDENLPPKIDLEADISQLEAPTFTTLNRGPPEPMLHLRWDHKVSLIGEKVLNPMIHSCDQCNKPILIYGRMIPCKHVFCLSCARKEDKACPRCMDPVSRVEQTNLGTVFMCTHGGSRYGNTGCRRTYLSQRDLQAHINHRHSVSGGDASPKVSGGAPAPPVQQQQVARKVAPPSVPTQSNDPRTESAAGYRAPSRTNLITVPIQQEPPPPPPPPPPQQSIYHPQSANVGNPPGGYPGPPPPPPVPPVQYAAGYPSGYYPAAPPGTYPPPQYPPPPPPDQPPQQYWQHPPPMHQFYR